MNTEIDLTKAREFVENLVKEAGEILEKYFTSEKYTQKSKGGVDFLTQADEEVDRFILQRLQAQFPQAHFLTEETAPKDYVSLSSMDNLWVVDPLDGTTNFSRKNPHFAISIALVHKGVSQLAVVYMPIAKDLYVAQRDLEGAFLNGERIQVSTTENLGEAIIACDWSWNLEKRLDVVRLLGNICTQVRQIKFLGSAVADLAAVANGRIDAYIHTGLKPWDVAASSLFIEKAGGEITTTEGKPWNVFSPDIFASNTVLHQSLLKLMKRK